MKFIPKPGAMLLTTGDASPAQMLLVEAYQAAVDVGVIRKRERITPNRGDRGRRRRRGMSPGGGYSGAWPKRRGVLW